MGKASTVLWHGQKTKFSNSNMSKVWISGMGQVRLLYEQSITLWYGQTRLSGMGNVLLFGIVKVWFSGSLTRTKLGSLTKAKLGSLEWAKQLIFPTNKTAPITSWSNGGEFFFNDYESKTRFEPTPAIYQTWLPERVVLDSASTTCFCCRGSLSFSSSLLSGGFSSGCWVHASSISGSVWESVEGRGEGCGERRGEGRVSIDSLRVIGAEMLGCLELMHDSDVSSGLTSSSLKSTPSVMSQFSLLQRWTLCRMNLTMSCSGKLAWHSPHTNRSFSWSTEKKQQKNTYFKSTPNKIYSTSTQ